jgi:hypothetical protein
MQNFIIRSNEHVYIEIIVHTYEAMSFAPQEPEILQQNLRMLSTQLYQQQQRLLVPSKLGQTRVKKI